MTAATTEPADQPRRRTGLKEWEISFKKVNWLDPTEQQLDRQMKAMSVILTDLGFDRDAEELQRTLELLKNCTQSLSQSGAQRMLDRIVTLAQVAGELLEVARTYSWPRETDRSSLAARLLTAIGNQESPTEGTLSAELGGSGLAVDRQLQALARRGYAVARAQGRMLPLVWWLTPRGEEAVQYWAQEAPQS